MAWGAVVRITLALIEHNSPLSGTINLPNAIKQLKQERELYAGLKTWTFRSSDHASQHGLSFPFAGNQLCNPRRLRSIHNGKMLHVRPMLRSWTKSISLNVLIIVIGLVSRKRLKAYTRYGFSGVLWSKRFYLACKVWNEETIVPFCPVVIIDPFLWCHIFLQCHFITYFCVCNLTRAIKSVFFSSFTRYFF